MISGSSNWNPTCFRRFIDSIDTDRKIALIETDMGRGYIKTMFQSKGPHPLACEFVGTQLAKFFGLPTLDFAIMTLQQDDEIPLGRDGREMALPGPAFVTRKISCIEWDGSSESLDRTENSDIISRLVVFDTWTLNWDRCPPEGDTRQKNYDNVLLSSENTSSPDRYCLLPIDHTECFSGGHDLSSRINTIDRVKEETVYGLFEPFKKYIFREKVEEAASLLGEFDRNSVEDFVDSIPPQWEVNTNTRHALTDFVCSRAHFLANNIVRLLSSSRCTDNLF